MSWWTEKEKTKAEIDHCNAMLNNDFGSMDLEENDNSFSKLLDNHCHDFQGSICPSEQ